MLKRGVKRGQPDARLLNSSSVHCSVELHCADPAVRSESDLGEADSARLAWSTRTSSRELCACLVAHKSSQFAPMHTLSPSTPKSLMRSTPM